MCKKTILKKLAAAVLALTVGFTVTIYTASGTVFAAPEAVVDTTNPWESGGQITLTLSGCDGYSKITVKADFGGSVTEAGGWGFDFYAIDGSVVTAVVSKDGPNSWGFNGSVGIQVTGSGIKDIKLLSVYGDSEEGKINSSGKPAPGPGPAGDDKKDPAKPDQPSKPGDTSKSDNKKGKTGDDWLTTDGSKIVDKNGTEVWLTGVNWFGYNTGTNIFDGCWSCNMESSLKAIADRGFNLLRIPISAELLLNWKNGIYPDANFNQAANADLVGLNSLQIFDRALEICEASGIKVMIDIHSAETDASGHNAPLWYTDKISADQYLEALDWVSARYKDNDTIVAYDLKNEPHGAGNEQNRAIWNDSKDANNWKYIAELAGNKILDNNPHALIVIEGNQIFPTDPKSNNFTSMNEGDYYNSWWGGNLMGVKYYPVDLGSKERNKQIVYSPHDYGPAVYQQPWFHGGFDYESLKKEYWNDYWLYIKTTDTAPILIGEWGGFMSGDNLTWMKYLRQLIGEYRLNYTFWCFNANSGDTGGLVLDDFTTWDEEKYAFVNEVMWKTSDGKPIGLDHEIALGSNGVNLSEYSGKKVDTAPAPGPADKPDPAGKPDPAAKPDPKTDETKPATTDTSAAPAAAETTATTAASVAADVTETSDTSADETSESTSTTETMLPEDVEKHNGEGEGLNDALYMEETKPARRTAEPIKLDGFFKVLKGVGIGVVVLFAAILIFIVVRAVLLWRGGATIKEILINLFKPKR